MRHLLLMLVIVGIGMGGSAMVVMGPSSADASQAGVIPVEWTCARMLQGAYGEGCGSLDGTSTLKCGGANRTGIATVVGGELMGGHALQFPYWHLAFNDTV